MNNQEKGLLYEKYVKNFIINNIHKNAYLWNECPENILIENALINSHNDMRLQRKNIKEGYLHNHKDIGIDIIQINDNKCSIVQCKNGYNNGLGVDDISGIMMRSNFLRDLKTFIYYTNCLSRNIRYTSNLSPHVVNIDCNNNIDKLLEISDNNKIYFVKLPFEKEEESKKKIKKDIVPYSYQSDAVTKIKKHFQNNNRGILSLPCGCGKTYISYLVSLNFNHIIILSPLRESATQNINKFIEYGYDKNKSLLVDTDGNRDIDTIKKFILNNKKLIISCTYNSMDLISECLELFNDALFIIDEFHNLSKSNVSQEDDKINKLLISPHRILFMSATPRIYDIEYDNEYTLDTQYLFGDVIYQMTFKDAIADKYITDYTIWLPSIHENNEQLDKELSIYHIDNKIINRCKFLYSCIANNGSRKCIIFCKDTEDMKNMIECMKTLNDFYIMDVHIESIICEDSRENRKKRLENFSNNDKIQLLFNIKILNECIDIPSCDSIYISYTPKNKISTIQRISRSTRINKNNHFKNANIYMWCEEYEDILETLSSIKEYDIMFKDKVKINALDFYHKKEDTLIELVENDKKLFMNNYILRIKEFKQYTWNDKLNELKIYIEKNKKLPSNTDTDKNSKRIANWISDQKKNHKNKTNIMKDDNNNIRKSWEEFIALNSVLFISNEEVWTDKLNELKIYIEKNKKLPSKHDKDEKKIASWIYNQKINHKNSAKIMKDDNNNIRKSWEEFIESNSVLFRSNEEAWNDKLNELKIYIEKNEKLPSRKDKDENSKRIVNWIYDQKINHRNKINIMKDDNIRKLWEEFIESNSVLFISNEEAWTDKLNELKIYIEKNEKLPSRKDTDDNNIRLATWVFNQKINHKNKTNIMKDNDIRKSWEEFIESNSVLFISNEEAWTDKLNELKIYIKDYNKLPCDKDENSKRIANWISNQKENHKNKKNIMKDDNDNIRKSWEEFIESNSDLIK
jgi:superfamily II DNA or RNA helicase/molybdopterin biosynthesis enzyme MoaB